jgi:hypothetical protein
MFGPMYVVDSWVVWLLVNPSSTCLCDPGM